MVLFCCTYHLRSWAFVRDSALTGIPEGACACGAEGRMASIGPPALGAKGCVERLRRFAQGAADWRSGPRWSITSLLCPVHPFATTWHFPSRGNKKFEEKNRESYTSCTTPAFPLWWLAPPPCPVGSMSLDSRVAGLPYESSSFATPASGALWMFSHVAMSLQESIETYSAP